MRMRQRRRRGQAILESGLVMSLTITVLMAALDIGQVLFLHQALVERARKTARYGSTHSSDLTAVKNVFLYDQTVAPDPGDGMPPPGYMGVQPSMVTVSLLSPSTNDERIEVKVTGYPFSFFTPWLYGSYSGKPISAAIPVEAP